MPWSARALTDESSTCQAIAAAQALERRRRRATHQHGRAAGDDARPGREVDGGRFGRGRVGASRRRSRDEKTAE